eukprot:TRINITY_DN32438_c0_g1_i1.p2 TRINITY_DN32438_c0_g1~~TRINITY_DN32438_c0_g1_i1.p2  ORF type:complete len:137 (-),score=24.99 TRINITY_DN32438_c0_g1_i1:43-453(-)
MPNRSVNPVGWRVGRTQLWRTAHVPSVPTVRRGAAENFRYREVLGDLDRVFGVVGEEPFIQIKRTHAVICTRHFLPVKFGVELEKRLVSAGAEKYSPTLMRKLSDFESYQRGLLGKIATAKRMGPQASPASGSKDQ